MQQKNPNSKKGGYSEFDTHRPPEDVTPSPHWGYRSQYFMSVMLLYDRDGSDFCDFCDGFYMER